MSVECQLSQLKSVTGQQVVQILHKYSPPRFPGASEEGRRQGVKMKMQTKEHSKGVKEQVTEFHCNL